MCQIVVMMIQVFRILPIDFFCLVICFINLFMLSSLVVGGVLIFVVVICLESFISGATCNGGATLQSLERIFEDGLQEIEAKDVQQDVVFFFAEWLYVFGFSIIMV